MKPVKKEPSAAVSGTATIIPSASNKDEQKAEAGTSFGRRFVDEFKIPALKFPTVAKHVGESGARVTPFERYCHIV